jgi:hypothetical protein
MTKLFDAVGRDLNAFYKSQSYAEDFDEAVNERMQQEYPAPTELRTR